MRQTGRTDVILQPFKLYIEGVQIPFDQIVINQGVGSLPSATLSVPPIAGLMDIARFYNPKVHIFYEDRTGSYLPSDSAAKKDKLIFTGHIVGTSYTKSKNGSGMVAIQFQCVHKNKLVTECLVDYSGWFNESLDQFRSTVAVKESHANSSAAILESLEGISGGVADDDNYLKSKENKTNFLPRSWKDFEERLQGMPGAMVNYWNQLNRAAFNPATEQSHDGFTKLYKPLIEKGLMFFQRMSGHYALEKLIEDSKEDPCSPTNSGPKKVLVPPCARLFLRSAVQAQLTVSLIDSYLQTSGEVTNIYEVFERFYNAIDYELITLASPAEVTLPFKKNEINGLNLDEVLTGDLNDPNGKTAPIETIIKPKMPFYYSPSCNILFPKMFHTINVVYDEDNIPTRISAKNNEILKAESSLATEFRAPASVRSAIAEKFSSRKDNKAPYNLLSSMANSYGAVGKYEQGRGVKVQYSELPFWLSHLSNTSYNSTTKVLDTLSDPTVDPQKAEALKDLADGWAKRYPNQKEQTMNIWGANSGISPHHRLLFASVDYLYTQMFARSKAGSVECPFNPYIIPGYPMDIIEQSPLLPSFHAMCTSVSHSIGSSSVSTSVSFTAAMTYSELVNYYIPVINPYLQVVLNLAKDPTLVNNTTDAITAAHDFYFHTLGVKAVAPEMLMDFETGLPKAVKLGSNGIFETSNTVSIRAENGGELNPYLTYEGNLSLVQRPIENKEDYSSPSRFNLKFIDLVRDEYNPTVIRYTNDNLTTSDKFEIGQNQFLNYDTKFGSVEISTNPTPGEIIAANRRVEGT